MNLGEMFGDWRPDWQSDALCRGCDPSWWYPERGAGVMSEASRRLCYSCPVAGECAAFGVRESRSIGTWGGLTPRMRRHLYRDGIVERDGVGWLHDRESGEVLVIADDAPSPEVARRLFRLTVADSLARSA